MKGSNFAHFVFTTYNSIFWFSLLRNNKCKLNGFITKVPSLFFIFNLILSSYSFFFLFYVVFFSQISFIILSSSVTKNIISKCRNRCVETWKYLWNYLWTKGFNGSDSLRRSFFRIPTNTLLSRVDVEWVMIGILIALHQDNHPNRIIEY